DSIYDLIATNYWHQTFQKDSDIPTELFQQELFDFLHNQGREPIKRIAQQMQDVAGKQAFEKAAKRKEDWLFLTRFANQ
ncbi:GIY-YIG nuclease family protein, partial [Enterococcus faecalis]